jgi:hypothetical protein
MVNQVPYSTMHTAFRWYHNIGDALHHFAHYGSFLSETQRGEANTILGSMQLIPMEYISEFNELKSTIEIAPINPNKSKIIKQNG